MTMTPEQTEQARARYKQERAKEEALKLQREEQFKNDVFKEREELRNKELAHRLNQDGIKWDKGAKSTDDMGINYAMDKIADLRSNGFTDREPRVRTEITRLRSLGYREVELNNWIKE